jgi:hypothetical protein
MERGAINVDVGQLRHSKFPAGAFIVAPSDSFVGNPRDARLPALAASSHRQEIVTSLL